MIFLIIFILLLFSFLFSIMETAFTGCSEGRVYNFKLDGNPHAEKLLKILEQKQAIIAMTLVVNNAVNIFASTLAASLAIVHFEGNLGVELAGLIMTLIIVIFCEIIPKKIGLKNPERFALFISTPIYFILTMFNKITSTLGFERKIAPKNELESNLESIRGEVAVLHTKGSVIKRDKDMIDGLLDLEEIEVNSIMTPKKKVLTIDLCDDIEEIKDKIQGSKYSRIPIYEEDEDNIVGVLLKVDFLHLLYEKDENLTTQDVKKILFKPSFVSENTRLKNQLLSFRKNKHHISIVVDEYGGMVGIVTLEDILEEIVGNIEDEYDKHHSRGIIKKDDGSFIVRGDFPVRDFNREMDTDFSLEDASSIAGLVIHFAEKIPEEGEKFVIKGYEFKVLKKHASRISLVRLIKLN